MRLKPYTKSEIKKVKCFRCGKPSQQQWQICADNGVYRAICRKCDISLNSLVLRWMRFKDWRKKLEKYKKTI